MTDKQQQVTKKHDTPEQFEKAVWKAFEDLFITLREAKAAIRQYRNERG